MIGNVFAHAEEDVSYFDFRATRTRLGLEENGDRLNTGTVPKTPFVRIFVFATQARTYATRVRIRHRM